MNIKENSKNAEDYRQEKQYNYYKLLSDYDKGSTQWEGEGKQVRNQMGEEYEGIVLCKSSEGR